MATYKDAGVNVEAGYEAVKLMRKHVEKTIRQEVLNGIGGFGGFFSLKKAKEMEDPVLVSGVDGVGTKLKIAFLMDRHNTVGMDCVAMCVNDVVCSGAEPLFFLDYIAVGKNRPQEVADIVKGVSEGCALAGCALIGGETAEMPGFYPEDEYDLAGFCVGIVDRTKIIDGSNIKAGDKLIGLVSSGLHSNGYSLVRKLLNVKPERLGQHIEKIGTTLGDELLKPTRIYVKTILELGKRYDIKGVANITGGGFIENIPRILPQNLKAVIKKGSWPVNYIFDIVQELGNVDEKEMYNTFNMGIGMVIAVENGLTQDIVNYLNRKDKQAYLIGEVAEGETGVEIC